MSLMEIGCTGLRSSNGCAKAPLSPQPEPSSSKCPEQRPVNWFGGFKRTLERAFSSLRKPKTKPVKDTWEIPYEDIKDLHFIGHGSQGTVFRGLLGTEVVAVKRMKEKREWEIVKELKGLSNPNVIAFRGVCAKAPYYCIVMEYCPLGSLYNLISVGTKIPSGKVIDSSRQIAYGMDYLHSRKIFHRDLKSSNILIGDNGQLKITDFGTCKELEDGSLEMSLAGTLSHMAPEMLRADPCSHKVDVWSFGVVLWEMLTCEEPYEGIESPAIVFGVGSGSLHLHVTPECLEGFKCLLMQCWNRVHRQRPTFREILIYLNTKVDDTLTISDEDYFRIQETWKSEINSMKATKPRNIHDSSHVENHRVRRKRKPANRSKVSDSSSGSRGSYLKRGFWRTFARTRRLLQKRYRESSSMQTSSQVLETMDANSGNMSCHRYTKAKVRRKDINDKSHYSKAYGPADEMCSNSNVVSQLLVVPECIAPAESSAIHDALRILSSIKIFVQASSSPTSSQEEDDDAGKENVSMADISSYKESILSLDESSSTNFGDHDTRLLSPEPSQEDTRIDLPDDQDLLRNERVFQSSMECSVSNFDQYSVREPATWPSPMSRRADSQNFVLTSSGEYLADEENTSEHSLGQHSRSEFFSSSSNPDIIQGLDKFTSSVTSSVDMIDYDPITDNMEEDGDNGH